MDVVVTIIVSVADFYVRKVNILPALFEQKQVKTDNRGPLYRKIYLCRGCCYIKGYLCLEVPIQIDFFFHFVYNKHGIFRIVRIPY